MDGGHKRFSKEWSSEQIFCREISGSTDDLTWATPFRGQHAATFHPLPAPRRGEKARQVVGLVVTPLVFGLRRLFASILHA